MSQPPAPSQRLWIWLLALAAFYGVWSWLVFGAGRSQVVGTHWPIAVAMAIGSYFAGSTPLGGGTVAFPVLVLLFGLPASLGRDFSFAIQATGMTSASFFLFARRQPLAGELLRGVITGSLVGTPIGILWLAPLLPEAAIKITFAVLWASFGVLHLLRLPEIAAFSGIRRLGGGWDFRLGVAVGALAGGTVVAVTGVGLEMATYTALVLLCRADLKLAIPTAVVGMAFTSVLGLGVKLATTGLAPGVFEHWLAAAPVVVLGAPFGAFVVAKIGRRPTLSVVAVLCILQYVWSCWSLRHTLGALGLAGTLAAVGLLVLTYEALRRWGARANHRTP